MSLRVKQALRRRYLVSRAEDIAAHPNQLQLLPRVVSNRVWRVRFLTLGQSQN